MRSRNAGFTLIELMIVVLLIAIASTVASLALRDPASTRLEQEAARLSALLESARAEARASGLEARWVPHTGENDQPPGFDFVGLPASGERATRWLHEGVSAEIVGGRFVTLGPEPMIGAQHIVLRLDEKRLDLTTDGLGQFVVGLADPATP